jgi:hypothetical protein
MHILSHHSPPLFSRFPGTRLGAGLALVLGLCVPVAATAQDVPERRVAVRFACLRYSGDVKTVFVRPKTGEVPVELRLYQGGFGQPLPALVENGKVNLYLKQETPAGETAWQPVAAAGIPAQGRAFTILLVPAKADEGGLLYQSMVLPEARDFPYGQAMILNLTPRNVRFDFGKKSVGVRPNTRSVTDFESEKDNFHSVAVRVALESAENQWTTLHTTRWNWNEKVRHLAIVWLNPAAQRPEITTLKENEPLEPAPVAGTER